MQQGKSHQLAYQQSGKRDLRLDWLRGYALFAMSINHAGFDSYLQFMTGNASFLISAAEVFLFISGYTLGFIAKGRDLGKVVMRTLNRAWTVYLVAIGIAFAFAALALATDLILWDDVSATSYGDLLEWGINVITMKEALHGSDILIAYVIYLALAPLALWGLLTGHTGKVLAATIIIYLLSQLSLDATALPVASFRHLAANDILFFGAMVLGFQRNWLGRTWRTWKPSRIIDGLVISVCLLLLVGYATNFTGFPAVLQDFLRANELGLREFVMPLPSLLIVLLYIRAAFILTTRWWQPLNRSLGWLLIPLGQASLFTFVMHLVAMPVLFNTPGVSEDMPLASASLWNIYYLGIIYGTVQLRRLWLTQVWTTPRQGSRFGRNSRVILTVLTGLALVTVAGRTSEPVWALQSWPESLAWDEDEPTLEGLEVEQLLASVTQQSPFAEVLADHLDYEVAIEVENDVARIEFIDEEQDQLLGVAVIEVARGVVLESFVVTPNMRAAAEAWLPQLRTELEIPTDLEIASYLHPLNVDLWEVIFEDEVAEDPLLWIIFDARDGTVLERHDISEDDDE
ncbi:MAG: OpgC domain-containing protein [Deinococcota bacterium]